jgi:hypothetical protein
MHAEIQKILDELTARNDSRTSVFDLQIQGLEDGKLALSGSLFTP